MATRKWLDANNDWSSTSNWSGSTIPQPGDDVIIDYGTKDISAGLNTGINGTATNSTNMLRSLTITSGYRGSIQDSSGGPLQISVGGTNTSSSAYFRVSQGGAAIKWKGGANVPIRVDSTGSGVFYIANSSVLNGRNGATTEDSRKLSLVCGQSGQVVIADGVTIGMGIISCGIGISCASSITTPDSTTPIQLYGGNHVWTASLSGSTGATPGGYVEVVNGTLSCVTASTDLSSIVVSQVIIGNGGRFINDHGGTVTALYNQVGGNLVPGSSKSYTITNYERYAGCVDNLSGPAASIAITNYFRNGSS